MTLEESKSKLLGTLKELKTDLQHRDFDILEDLDILEDPIRVNFNGWTTIEGFENHLFDQYNELQETLKVSYLYDLDIKKKDTLLQMVIADLSFLDYMCHFKGQDNKTYQSRKDELKENLFSKLNEFEATQDRIKDEIVNNLEMMLSANEDSNRIKHQIKWQGTQVQLAGLFGKLIQQGWIAKPTEQDFSAFTHTLATIFDLTPTYKKENPDIAENLRHYLKPDESNNGNLRFTNCMNAIILFSDLPKNVKILKNK